MYPHDIGVSDFKARFDRDFEYGDTISLVKDSDIERALDEALLFFNKSLYQSENAIKSAFLYLAAHILVINLRNASNSLEESASFPVSSHSAGSVSESFSIPQKYINDPILSGYTQTNYGMKFLAITLPALTGNVAAISGGTQP
ncbi:MAG: DUF4054 domain-containing protein [Rickettsiales bacterium]